MYLLSKSPLTFTASLIFGAVLLSHAAVQTSANQNDSAGVIKQARKLSMEGKQDEAIALYRQALTQEPNSYQAYLGIGAALDLKGQYGEARQNFTKAIELAPAEDKPQAERAMAISYAFQRKANDAAKYEQQAFNAQLARNDYFAAAETADELARIYLESGDFDNAYRWYQIGYDTGLKEPNISDARKNLWGFRWENAQARIAARRGKREEAEKHVAAAKAYLDKGGNPQQERFWPYLTGYVAFYLGDYKKAIADLQQADQRDPFVLCLLAQAYEKSGDQAQAQQYYRKILSFNMHSPTNAFARPLAEQKLS